MPQIMWPSLYLKGGIEESEVHQRIIQFARQGLRTIQNQNMRIFEYLSHIRHLMGEDMDFDFDMIIAKGAGSDVETPWHQDESYWLDLPDKRALSFWIPMQDVTVRVQSLHLDNGLPSRYFPGAKRMHVVCSQVAQRTRATPAPPGQGGPPPSND